MQRLSLGKISNSPQLKEGWGVSCVLPTWQPSLWKSSKRKGQNKEKKSAHE